MKQKKKLARRWASKGQGPAGQAGMDVERASGKGHEADEAT